MIKVGILDMQDSFLARMFAAGLTPWVMSPGSDLILWSKQLNHVVSRMAEALQKPYSDFVCLYKGNRPVMCLSVCHTAKKTY